MGMELDFSALDHRTSLILFGDISSANVNLLVFTPVPCTGKNLLMLINHRNIASRLFLKKNNIMNNSRYKIN
jgi:hypothetical protein